jgi:hypothetical protein
MRRARHARGRKGSSRRMRRARVRARLGRRRDRHAGHRRVGRGRGQVRCVGLGCSRLGHSRLGRSRSGRDLRRDRLGRGRGRRLGLVRVPLHLGPRRQERHWVDVALVLCRHAQPEIDERLSAVDGAARPDCPHYCALLDVSAAADAHGAEVDERGGVAERRLERDRVAAVRHRSGEADDSVGGREHVRARRCGEIDAAVLACRVRVRTVEGKRAKDGAVDRPCPRLRHGHGQGKPTEHHDSESPEHEASLLPGLRTRRP